MSTSFNARFVIKHKEVIVNVISKRSVGVMYKCHVVSVITSETGRFLTKQVCY